MRLTTLHTRQTRDALMILALCGLLFPTGTLAQAPGATLELRPHCTAEEKTGFGGPVPVIPGVMTITDGDCATFVPSDPLNRQTPPLAPGDILDVDLVLRTAGSIRSVRTWIAYDPTVLEGIDVTLADMKIPRPGDNVFLPTQGYITVGASSTTDVSKEPVVVARIRMRVLQTPQASTVLGFTGVGDRTVAIRSSGGTDTNVLATMQPSLIVRIMNAPSSVQTAGVSAPSSRSSSAVSSVGTSSVTSTSSFASTSSASSTSTSSFMEEFAGSTTPPLAGSSVFGMLQPQRLRVTTQGGSIHAAWDPIPSSELAGYAVYYGAVSGRYLHRRTVSREDSSVILRALPEGITQYVAVRGVDAMGRETEFSEEASVTVGDPATSTSPLAAAAISPPTPATGGVVAGSTGMGTAAVALLGSAAAVGMLFAFRRQFVATRVRS